MLATGIVTLSALTSQAEAGVIWTFEQDGPNVTAVVGGSFSVDVVGVGGFSVTDFHVGGAGVYVTRSAGAYVQAQLVGAQVRIDVDQGASIPGTGTFGHSGPNLFWDPSLGDTLVAGTDVAGGSTVPSLTWNGATLDTIFGGGFFDNGPVTAWTLDNGASTDTISFVAAAVPEPSSSLLIGLGAFGLLARRKR
jgi:hypothetical protein